MARPRSFDEAAILDEARNAFWVGGYAATTLGDIMNATGLGKGSLYGAFGDKHALFARVFGDYCDGLVTATRAVLSENNGQPGAMVANYLRRSTSTSDADLGQRGCLLATATAELAPHDPAIVERAEKTLQAITGLLEDTIHRSQQKGEITAEAPPHELAGLVLTISRGLDAMRRAGTSPDDLAGIAETAVRIVLRPTPPTNSGNQLLETK